MDFQKEILDFLCVQVGGIVIVEEESGRIVYADSVIRENYGGDLINACGEEVFSWLWQCPKLGDGESAVEWEVHDAEHGRFYSIRSGGFQKDGKRYTIHFLLDIGEYMGLNRDMLEYVVQFRDEKEHDQMTGLYNKGKFLAMERTYRDMDSIGVINLDVNDLKETNDKRGHEMGDKLLKKAAESIRRVTGPKVHGYRMGGDEFMMIVCDATEAEVEEIKTCWERELEQLNQADDGVNCVIAAGVAYGKKGCDYVQLLREADEKMYADKKKKKHGREVR